MAAAFWLRRGGGGIMAAGRVVKLLPNGERRKLGASAGGRRRDAAPPPAKPAPAGRQEAAVRISEEVVGAIASMAASEVEGVAGMSPSLVDGLSEMLGKKGVGKGVRVEVGTREAAVDLFLAVEYGVRIPVVAQRVQERVKEAIEAMTGLRVVEVNIHVQGVSFGSGHGAVTRVLE